MRRSLLVIAGAVACAAVCAASVGREIDALERAVSTDPEDLKVAADYRQLAIAGGDFDRPIDLLEKLAKRKDSGPNVQISLALAYVDKVPTSGDIRRLTSGATRWASGGSTIGRARTKPGRAAP